MSCPSLPNGMARRWIGDGDKNLASERPFNNKGDTESCKKRQNRKEDETDGEN